MVRREQSVSELLDKFVCVRLVQANALDLNQFQFDFDLTFAVFFMNEDGTIYGRYGSRSSMEEAEHDISLEGLAKAMEGALALHSRYPLNKASLEGKRRNLLPVSRPEELPGLDRFGPTIDYAGKTAQSCMHCHQIRDAQRRQVRQAGQPLPDELLYPYPMPDAVGLTLDVNERAKIKSVAPDSAASRAGFQPEDEIVSLAGQPIISIADVQWVLHSSPEPKTQPAKIAAQVRRNGQMQQLSLELAPGWRRASDFGWRVSTWDIRRMAGGMKVDDLPDDERRSRGIGADSLALLVKHVGQFGEHQNAKRAGIQNNDLIVAFDGQQQRMTETELLAYVAQECRPGKKVPVQLRRGGRTIDVMLTLQ